MHVQGYVHAQENLWENMELIYSPLWEGSEGGSKFANGRTLAYVPQQTNRASQKMSKLYRFKAFKTNKQTNKIKTPSNPFSGAELTEQSSVAIHNRG